MTRAGQWVCLTITMLGCARTANAQAVSASPPALPRDFDSDFVLGASAPTNARRIVRERGLAARPAVVELRGGVATVVGLLGVTMSFAPISRLSLGAGFGANTSGVQLAAFARVRPLVLTSNRWACLHAIGFELGYSTGPFRDYLAPAGDGPDSSLATFSYERVQWLQPQLTYETQSFRGFNLLAGLGVEIPIAHRGYQCLDALRCTSNHLTALPTATVGVGWAMGL